MRTPCGVGQQDGVLLTLVGLSLWDCPTPNHIYIVPQTFQLVNTFFKIFLVVGVGIEPHIHLLLSRCPTIERPNHFCQVLYFSEKILGENLVVLSFPSPCGDWGGN